MYSVVNCVFESVADDPAVCAIYLNTYANAKYVVKNNKFVGEFTEAAIVADMGMASTALIEIEGNDFSEVEIGCAWLHVYTPNWVNLREDIADDSKITH